MALRRQRDLINAPLTKSKLDPTDPIPKKLRRDRTLKGPTHATLTQVGATGVGESQYDQDINIRSLGKLNSLRANRQPWHHQAANMIEQMVVGEIIGGSIESLGYIGDIDIMKNLADGTEKEFGNFITEFGKNIREKSKDSYTIYQQAPGEFDPTDSGWWFGNGVSVASSLSMLLPSMAATKALSVLGKGVSKGMGMINKSMDIASKMGKQSKWMATGITQAITSRHMENLLEASGTFDEKFDEYKAQGMDEGVARDLASEAASFNYKAGWAMLAQDIPQYLLIGKVFNPITGKVQSKMAQLASKGQKPGYTKKLLTGALNAAGEGAEEGYQFIIAEEGKHFADVKAGLTEEGEFNDRLSEYVTDGEFWTSAVFGALGGALFQAVGPQAGELFKTKKQRDQNKNMKKMNEDFIKMAGMEIAQAHDFVAGADQEGNPLKMKGAREHLNLVTTMRAIETDSMDFHIETLNSMLNMTEEEAAVYKEQGIDIQPELLKEYIPGMIKAAREIEVDYLKYRNNNPQAIARKMTYNNHYVKNFTNLVGQSQTNINKIVNSVPRVKELSSHGDKIIKGLMNTYSIQRALELQKDTLSRKGTKKEKESVKKHIEANEKLLKKQEQANNKLQKEDKRSSTEKATDNEVNEGFIAEQELLAEHGSNIILGKQKITLLQKENNLLKKKTYQDRFMKAELDKELSKLKTEEDIIRGYEIVNQDKLLTDKEKVSRVKALDKRLESIKRKEKADAEKAEKENLKEQAIAEKKEHNQNETFTIDESKERKKVDAVEDHIGEREIDLSEDVMSKQDGAATVYQQARNDMRVTDAIGSDVYLTWLTNGENKIGTEVEYVIGSANDTTERRAAIANFNEAVKAGDPELLTEDTFKYLPVQVQFGEAKDDNYSYIIDGASKFRGPQSEGQKSFEEDELPERMIIISAMVSGNAKSTVAKQYGGELVLEPNKVVNDETVYPNNKLTDLHYLNGEGVGDLDIAVSDGDGILIGEDKIQHPKLKHKMMVKDSTGKGSTAPYSGGVFLNVPKADGHRFPLKLNLTFPSLEEATTLADLMIDVVNKTYNWKMSLGEAFKKSPEFAARVKEHHAKELTLLGKDASVSDFVQTFVRMDDATEGKEHELFFSGGWIRFGQGLVLKPETQIEGRTALIEYLNTQKRRQFKLSKWTKSKDNPNWKKYREYMVNNGILSTNATVNGPLFAKSKERGGRTPSLYIESMNVGKTSRDAVERLHDAQAKGVQMNDNRMWEATYINAKEEEITFYGATQQQAVEGVSNAYQAEQGLTEYLTPDAWASKNGAKPQAKTDIKKEKKEEEDFPKTQANTRTEVTVRLLNKVAEVNGDEPYKGSIKTGQYISWLKKQGNLGQEVANMLNTPAKANEWIERVREERLQNEAAKAATEEMQAKREGSQEKIVPSPKLFGDERDLFGGKLDDTDSGVISEEKANDKKADTKVNKPEFDKMKKDDKEVPNFEVTDDLLDDEDFDDVDVDDYIDKCDKK